MCNKHCLFSEIDVKNEHNRQLAPTIASLQLQDYPPEGRELSYLINTNVEMAAFTSIVY